MSEGPRTLVLAISIALNVFIVGAAVGAAYAWHASEPVRLPVRGGLFVATKTLPVNERRVFRRMLMQARKEGASDIAAARAGRLDLAQLMVADPLNRQAVEARLSAIRQADIALRIRLEKAVVDFAETLTPAERKSFVEGLRGRSAMLRRKN